MLGLREDLFDIRPLVRVEILLELRAGQGKNHVPRHAESDYLIDKHLVAANGDGGQAESIRLGPHGATIPGRCGSLGRAPGRRPAGGRKSRRHETAAVGWNSRERWKTCGRNLTTEMVDRPWFTPFHFATLRLTRLLARISQR